MSTRCIKISVAQLYHMANKTLLGAGVMLIFCMVAFCGCGTEKSSNIRIDLEDASAHVINVRDMADECQWIQLDSIPDAIIGDATRIIEHDDDFYILDLSTRKEVVVFDKDGKYINSIGRHGSGEGEYADILDFAVNTSTGDITILSSGSMVYVYTKDGKFKKSSRLTESLLWHIAYAGGQYILSTDNCTYPEGENSYLLYCFNDDLQETGKYVRVLSRQMPSLNIFEGMLSTRGGRCYYMDMFSRSLYEMKEDEAPCQLFEFMLPDPMPLSVFEEGMEFFMQQTRHDWIKSFLPLNDSFLLTYVAGGSLCIADITYVGQVAASGLIAGVMPKMFPGQGNSILSPVSRQDYETEWLGLPPDRLAPEVMESNLMLMKWSCSAAINNGTQNPS